MQHIELLPPQTLPERSLLAPVPTRTRPADDKDGHVWSACYVLSTGPRECQLEHLEIARTCLRRLWICGAFVCFEKWTFITSQSAAHLFLVVFRRSARFPPFCCRWHTKLSCKTLMYSSKRMSSHNFTRVAIDAERHFALSAQPQPQSAWKRRTWKQGWTMDKDMLDVKNGNLMRLGALTFYGFLYPRHATLCQSFGATAGGQRGQPLFVNECIHRVWLSHEWSSRWRRL